MTNDEVGLELNIVADRSGARKRRQRRPVDFRVKVRQAERTRVRQLREERREAKRQGPLKGLKFTSRHQLNTKGRKNDDAADTLAKNKQRKESSSSLPPPTAEKDDEQSNDSDNDNDDIDSNDNDGNDSNDSNDSNNSNDSNDSNSDPSTRAVDPRTALPDDEVQRAQYLAEFHARPLELDRRAGAQQHPKTARAAATTKTASQHLFETHTSWQDYQFPPRLCQAVQSQYPQPTVIQTRAWRALHNNNNQKNVLIQSETGSGKTLAYLLPILQSLAQLQSTTKTRRQLGTRALILCPTRELAAQTLRTVEHLCTHAFCGWLVPGALLGTASSSSTSGDASPEWSTCAPTAGNPRQAEKARLRKGLGIVVATPGRCLDHLQKTQALTDGLKQCSSSTTPLWLVLDEADRLLDMGLGEQVQRIVRDHLQPLLSDWRSILVSATVTPAVQRLAHKIVVGHQKKNNSNHNDSAVETTDDAWIWVKGGDDNNNSNSKSNTTTKETNTKAAVVSPNDKKERNANHEDEEVTVLPSTTAVSLGDTTPRQLAQWHMTVTGKLRLPALLAVLVQRVMKRQRTVVFFDTCTSVDYHYELLRRAPSIVGRNNNNKEDNKNTNPSTLFGPNCTIHKLHGKVPHHERQAVLAQFTKGNDDEDEDHEDHENHHGSKTASILLATDVAARGLNLHQFDWTVQYDPPSEVADYVHRAGRVARAGNVGNALIFLLPSEKAFLQVLENAGLAKLSTLSPLSLADILLEASKHCKQVTEEGLRLMGAGGQKTTLNSSRRAEAFSMQVQRSLEAFVAETAKASEAAEEAAAAAAAAVAGTSKARKGGHKRLLKKNNNKNDNLLELAREAYTSHIRAYPTREKAVRPIFAAKALHLGHAARAFALSEPPKNSAKKSKQQFDAANPLLNKKEKKKRKATAVAVDDPAALEFVKRPKTGKESKHARAKMMENALKLQGMQMM